MSADMGNFKHAHAVNGAGESVWLTLRHGLFLFLSTNPNDKAPYAFIRLQDAVLRDVDHGGQQLVLAGRPKPAATVRAEQASAASNPEKQHSPFGDSSARLPLPLCFLMADGRFQPFEALWLEIQFDSDEGLETWARELGAACDGLDTQEKEQKAKAGAKFTGPKGRGSTRAPTAPLSGSPPPAPPMLAEERENSFASSAKTGPSPRPAG